MILPKNLEILPPYDDRIFKTMLTHPDAKPALMDLISATTGRNVTDVEVRNNELPVASTEEKNERLDVNCVIDNGDQIDVEMQGSRLEEIADGHLNFINKSVYYLTDLHSSQKSKGVNYYELVRTYQVTFSTYTIFPGYSEYFSRISLRRPDGELVSDQINMIIVELSKLGEVIRKPIEMMTSLEMWSAFLKFAPDPRYRGIINKLIDRRRELAMAAEVLTAISEDERERAKLMSRKKFETDMYSNIHTAEERGRITGRSEGMKEGRAEGMKEGRTEGKAEAVTEIIRNMKALGMSIDDIARITDMPLDEAAGYYEIIKSE